MLNRSLVLRAFIALTLTFSFLSPSASAAQPTLGGGADVTYVENADAVLAGAGLTVANGVSFDGKYIEFAIASQAATDILDLQKVGTASTVNGEVSVVGTQVYVGDGAAANPFASIDETKNGQNGQPLRINFQSAFGNSGFENATTGALAKDAGNSTVPSISTALAGWTIVGLGNQDHYINIGETSLAGFVSNDNDNVYPANAATQKDNNKPSSATFSAEITTAEKSEGSKSLRLYSTMQTLGTCDVVHGPAAVSDPFAASQNDVISFDWSAVNGGDDYDAYGYIVNTATGAQTEVIDSNGSTQAWTTKSTTIPATGNYRFVFINGTHDLSCGRAAGGSLYIDNIRVVGNKASDANVQAVARLLTYKSTSDNPAASRTVTFTAVPATGASSSLNFNINITPVNDPVTFADLSRSIFNTQPNQVFSDLTGTFAPTDPDNNSFTYTVTDGTSANGSTSKAGTYGTLTVNETSGAYTYDPNDAAINVISANQTDVFTITASDGVLSDPATLTINVYYESAAITAPATLTANQSATNALNGVSVSGLESGTDYLISLTLNNAPNGTSAKIDTLGTAELGYGYSAGAQNSFTQLTLIGTATEINSALATLKIVTGATVGTPTLTITATKSQAGLSFFDGRYYVARTGGAYVGVSWSDASAAAKASTYLGVSGYLVTITSQAEQDFVSSRIPNASNIWIGATDVASEGAWEWAADGGSPEAGKQFWQGAANGTRFTGDGLNYDNWCAGSEPNNAASSEHYAVTNWNNSPCWNDLPNSFGQVQGYVIEYGTGGSGFGFARSDSKSISINISGAPTNTSVAATNIAMLGATLNSTVVANGADATNRFCITTSSTLNNCAVTDSAVVTTLTPTSNATTTGFVSNSVSFTVSDLLPNTTYYYQSYSTNSIGGPIYGAVKSFTTLPAESPGKPLVSPGVLAITITIVPPQSGNPISYTVTANPGGATCNVNAGSTNCTINGLSSGTSYTFTAVANYQGASSAPSVPSDPISPFMPDPVQTDSVSTPQVNGNNVSANGNFSKPISNVSINGNTLDKNNWSQSPNSLNLNLNGFPPGIYKVTIFNGSVPPLTFTVEVTGKVEEPKKDPEPTPEIKPEPKPEPKPADLAPKVITPSEIPAGSSVVTIDGKVTTLSLKPNETATGLTLEADTWKLTLGAANTNNEPLKLDTENRVVVERELTAITVGTGFKPGTEVQLYIFSTPFYLGSAPVKADGTFEKTSKLPSTIELGEHVIQVNGISPNNEVRSANFEVVVVETKPVDPTPKEEEQAEEETVKTTVKSYVVGFGFDKKKLTNKQLAKLRKIDFTSATKVTVVGYAQPTDPKTDPALSRQRAKTVVKALQSLQPKLTISSSGMGGKRNPLCKSFKNKCAVITVTGAEKG